MSLTNLLSFLAGLGIFMFGITTMSEGLEYAAGSKLKKILGSLTKNKFLAVLMGTVVTALIQSSSATTVMVVGFVNAGLMNLTQAAGVIMGANIGTTITSVLIAMNLTDIAPIALFVGVFMYLFVKKDIVKHIGKTIAGFGMLFWGLGAMSTAMEPLRDSEVFVYFITNFNNPIVGILIGIVLTAIIQSSSASIGILQALAFQGLVPINFAVYIILGQNIGTVVTALLSSMASKTNSKRTAVIHLLFNVFGTIIFLFITAFTPYTSLLQKISSNVAVQISAAHIIFNVVSTVIMFPFANQLIKLSCLIVPDKEPKDSKLEFEFYDTRLLNTPTVAVEQIGKEVERMARLAYDNFDRSSLALIKSDDSQAQKVNEVENVINFLNHEITRNLVKINSLDLSKKDSKYIGRLFHVVNDIERIGDHAINLIEAAQVRCKEDLKISDEAVSELEKLRLCVLELLEGSINAFTRQTLSYEEATRLNTLETVTDELKEKYEENHITRLNENRCETRAGLMFINTLVDFERIGDHAKNIAWSVGDRPKKNVETDNIFKRSYEG